MAATFRRRLRRGAASTAVAAFVLAALTASQSPDATAKAAKEQEPSPPVDTPIDGGATYYTDLPPHNNPAPHRRSSPSRPDGGTPVITGPAQAGIPASVLAAYKRAQSRLDAEDPGCRLPWQLLAGIGKVESGQAGGGAVDAVGTTLRPILGPQLNGNGFARILDTDGGRYDGDTTHDRAVGPMQFIPSTWSQGGPGHGGWGADGNGDGKKDPNNVYDAALAAGRYLCADGRDLSDPRDLDRAVLGYNNSAAYLRTVLSWYTFYRKGTYEVPDGHGALPAHRRPTHTSGNDNGNGTRHGRGNGPGRAHGKGPGTPVGPRPEPNGPARPGGSGSGHTPGAPTPKPRPGTPAPAKPGPVTALTRAGDQDLTATAGTDFVTAPRVRAKDAAGKPVAGVRIRFTLPAGTDARFPGNATAVTVTTGKDGLATAPTLHAGDQAGDFTLRATAVGRTLPTVTFDATVKAKPAPKADTLTRTSDKELTATAGQAFAEDAVEIEATYQGKIAAGVPVTATMVTDDPDKPVENDRGPYFKDPHATGANKDKPVRTLAGLTTDANGLLKLPKIYTDAHTGTFLLRLTTDDGAVLTVKLKVSAPAAS